MTLLLKGPLNRARQQRGLHPPPPLNQGRTSTTLVVPVTHPVRLMHNLEPAISTTQTHRKQCNCRSTQYHNNLANQVESSSNCSCLSTLFLTSLTRAPTLLWNQTYKSTHSMAQTLRGNQTASLQTQAQSDQTFLHGQMNCLVHTAHLRTRYYTQSSK